MSKFNKYLEAVQDDKNEDFKPGKEYVSFFNELNKVANKEFLILIEKMRVMEKEYMIKHNITKDMIDRMKTLIIQWDTQCDPSTIGSFYCMIDNLSRKFKEMN